MMRYCAYIIGLLGCTMVIMCKSYPDAAIAQQSEPYESEVSAPHNATEEDTESDSTMMQSYLDMLSMVEAPIIEKSSSEDTARSTKSPIAQIRDSQKSSLQEPSDHALQNSVVVYNYWEQFMYKIYTSPQRITMIRLSKDEEIVGNLASGDTANWIISIAENKDSNIIYIKPIRSDLSTNLIVHTTKRTYYLVLVSLVSTYMVSVEWRYPLERITPQNARKRIIDMPISLDKLYFGYQLIPVHKAPSWMPSKVFDDGIRTFIQFSNKFNIAEAPALYSLDEKGNAILINYRVIEDYYVTDKVLYKGELRLGNNKKHTVKIVRLKP